MLVTMWRPIPLSNFAKQLPSDIQNRYYEKIEIVNVDPFYIRDWHLKWKRISDKDFQSNFQELEIPLVSKTDIFQYCVNTVSCYTNLEFKSFKTLDSYNAFISNHALDVKWITRNDYHIVIGKVKHSQSQIEGLLKVRLILTLMGPIKTVHCTCVALLGEACSHSGAVAVYLKEFHQAKINKSCTEIKCYWVQPSSKL